MDRSLLFGMVNSGKIVHLHGTLSAAPLFPLRVLNPGSGVVQRLLNLETRIGLCQ